jgi:hypothetical protein
VANEVAQLFFEDFAKGDPLHQFASVGPALHRVRQKLLRKGNLMGLAYTTYCSADLHFQEILAAK